MSKQNQSWTEVDSMFGGVISAVVVVVGVVIALGMYYRHAGQQEQRAQERESGQATLLVNGYEITVMPNDRFTIRADHGEVVVVHRRHPNGYNGTAYVDAGGDLLDQDRQSGAGWFTGTPKPAPGEDGEIPVHLGESVESVELVNAQGESEPVLLLAVKEPRTGSPLDWEVHDTLREGEDPPGLSHAELTRLLWSPSKWEGRSFTAELEVNLVALAADPDNVYLSVWLDVFGGLAGWSQELPRSTFLGFVTTEPQRRMLLRAKRPGEESRRFRVSFLVMANSHGEYLAAVVDIKE